MKKSSVKHARPAKQQLGQFLTPDHRAADAVAKLPLNLAFTYLEPSFGKGAFIFALIERLLPLFPKETPIPRRLEKLFASVIYGVELDPEMYRAFFEELAARYDFTPKVHHLRNEDFLTYTPGIQFDVIMGNPPFGGTIPLNQQAALEKLYGTWDGYKIKKETYSFFIHKSLTHLAAAGKLLFICSDTFLTISTMTGIRRLLYAKGAVEINRISHFSEETDYGMVLIRLDTGRPSSLCIEGVPTAENLIACTPNFSFGADVAKFAKYLEAPTLSNFVTCSSGMTIGKNELFVREIKDGAITETKCFGFSEEPLSLEKELARANLGKLSAQSVERLEDRIAKGETERMVQITPGKENVIKLPHSDYRYYNKAANAFLFAEPKWAVFWKDDGDAVYTYKKNGPVYLHGVGGKKFFGKEGITWGLMGSEIKARYLPAGYILDSGSPIAVLKPGLDPDELYFILGWLMCPLASAILKGVVNHTKNIQGKDIERLPYPAWVSAESKAAIISLVSRGVKQSQDGTSVNIPAIRSSLTNLFAMPGASIKITELDPASECALLAA